MSNLNLPMQVYPFQAGGYRGEILGATPPDAALIERLARVRDWSRSGSSLSNGPHAVVRHELSLDGVPVQVAVKSFRRIWWRDRDFARNGSKGQRSFRTATRLLAGGVGTPRPIAWLDRWEGGSLAETYYVSVYERGATFREELDRLFVEDPLCRRILALMETVAQALARMHEAGVWHLDLGNQNILVDRLDEERWGNVRVIDLDRSRLHDALTEQQRARDISRIDLPSALLSIFKCMYYGDRMPPKEFQAWEAHYRKRFRLHTASRKYRHPIRTLRARGQEPAAAAPTRGDLWLWDDRSEQAIGARTKGDRYAAYPLRNGFNVVRGLARAAWPVKGIYRDLMAKSFSGEVALAGRIGMSAGPATAHAAAERELLAKLGAVPVLLRLYRHARHEENAETLAEARRLKAAGHSIFLALVQDRACIREPGLWIDFIETWLPAFDGIADGAEIGHAVNRIKWGVQQFTEYRELVETVVRRARRTGSFALTGPAAIDFEYHFLAGLLDALPAGSFDALSHHLYVDRRGAPENRQSKHFSSVEKFALAKAFAAWSPAVRSDRLIVSEVNWPVAGSGVHSPIAAPYISPGTDADRGAVDEQTYADFMLRYYALALCSGLVEQVYWWRLIARGFGLVDDTGGSLRPRPAYDALRQFVTLLGDSTYEERLAAGDGVWALRFRRPGGERVVMAWAHPAPTSFRLPFATTAMLSRDGAEVASSPTEVVLDGSPRYFRDVR